MIDFFIKICLEGIADIKENQCWIIKLILSRVEGITLKEPGRKTEHKPVLKS